jgi:hypothetical protein
MSVPIPEASAFTSKRDPRSRDAFYNSPLKKGKEAARPLRVGSPFVHETDLDRPLSARMWGLLQGVRANSVEDEAISLSPRSLEFSPREDGSTPSPTSFSQVVKRRLKILSSPQATKPDRDIHTLSGSLLGTPLTPKPAKPKPAWVSDYPNAFL